MHHKLRTIPVSIVEFYCFLLSFFNDHKQSQSFDDALHSDMDCTIHTSTFRAVPWSLKEKSRRHVWRTLADRRSTDSLDSWNLQNTLYHMHKRRLHKFKTFLYVNLYCHCFSSVDVKIFFHYFYYYYFNI